jgi:hypothetical protein
MLSFAFALTFTWAAFAVNIWFIGLAIVSNGLLFYFGPKIR